MEVLGFNLPLLPSKAIELSLLDKVLNLLNQLKPLQKPLVLKAMAKCVTHDNQIHPEEAELFRAIADSLDCPVPPILEGQKLL